MRTQTDRFRMKMVKCRIIYPKFNNCHSKETILSDCDPVYVFAHSVRMGVPLVGHCVLRYDQHDLVSISFHQ